jgi:hypothetical protein
VQLGHFIPTSAHILCDHGGITTIAVSNQRNAESAISATLSCGRHRGDIIPTSQPCETHAERQ